MTSTSATRTSRRIAAASVDCLAASGWAIAFVVLVAVLSPAFEQYLEGVMYALANL